MRTETQLITIDGMAAAGKTIQAKLLAEALNAENISKLTLLSRVELRREGRYEKETYPRLLLQLFQMKGAMFDYERWYGKDKKIITTDEFWLAIREMDKHRDQALDIMKNVITLGGSPPPVASFYIHVTKEESELRWLKRHTERNGYYDIENIEMQVKEQHRDYPFDDIELEFWNWLSHEVPYLHIINGMKAQEAVTDSMLRILEHTYGITPLET